MIPRERVKSLVEASIINKNKPIFIGVECFISFKFNYLRNLEESRVKKNLLSQKDKIYAPNCHKVTYNIECILKLFALHELNILFSKGLFLWFLRYLLYLLFVMIKISEKNL